jgi:glutamyl/glutaminyl-tRNA synthetase
MCAWRVTVSLTAGEPLTLQKAHTAVCAWLLALSHGGTPILHLTSPSLTSAAPLLEELRWLGLDWDEGPEEGGPYPPYWQPADDGLYTAVAEQLRQNQDAYIAPDGSLCLYKPSSGSLSYTDPEAGQLRFNFAQLPPPVLLTPTGEPTAWFRQTLNNHRQHITHTVCPATNQTNLPNSILLCRLLEWSGQTWVHLPPLLGAEAQTPIARWREAGYLPGAVFQYILQLGWRPPDDRPLWFRADARKLWHLGDLPARPITPELGELARLNKLYVARLDDVALAGQIRPYLQEDYGLLPTDERWLVALAGIIRPALTTLGEASWLAEWALGDEMGYELGEGVDTAVVKPHLLRLLAELSHIVLLDKPTAAAIVASFPPEVQASFLSLLTGQPALTDLPGVMALLGKERCLRRTAQTLRTL